MFTAKIQPLDPLAFRARKSGVLAGFVTLVTAVHKLLTGPEKALSHAAVRRSSAGINFVEPLEKRCRLVCGRTLTHLETVFTPGEVDHHAASDALTPRGVPTGLIACVGIGAAARAMFAAPHGFLETKKQLAVGAVPEFPNGP